MPSNRRLSSLTVVAPFFNEQDGASEFHRRLSDELAALLLDCNFVFVDDGSTDATLRVLNDVADRDPRVTVIGLSRNWGHQIALTAGLDYAQGEAVIVMDSDLQHPPEAIARMGGEDEKGADVVYGVRGNQPKTGFLKRGASRWVYPLLRPSTHVQIVG